MTRATEANLTPPSWKVSEETTVSHRLGVLLLVALVVLGLILVTFRYLGADRATNLSGSLPAGLSPDLMILQPTAVPAGGATTVRFAQQRSRGVVYLLGIEVDQSWEPLYMLTAGVESYSDGTPHWDEIGPSSGWDEVAVTNDGPDDLVIPDTAVVGTYRLCTTGSSDNICALLTVTSP